MKIVTANGKQQVKISKKDWERIGKEAGWHDTSPKDTDEGNEVGKWEGGWLNGEWKCPNCGTMIGKNLKNESPYALVEEHKKSCSASK